MRNEFNMRTNAPRIPTLVGTAVLPALALAMTCGIALGKTKADDKKADGPKTDSIVYVQGGEQKTRAKVVVSSADWDAVKFKAGSIGGSTVVDIVWGDAPREYAQGLRALRTRDGRAAKDAFVGCMNARAAGIVERAWIDELAQVGLGEAYLLLALKDDAAYGKAKNAFQAALDANAKSLHANQILRGLAEAELGQGNAAAAQKHADALVTAGRSARRPLWEVDGLFLRATTMRSSGNTAGAGTAYKDAARVAGQYASTEKSPSAKKALASLQRQAAAQAGWVVLDAAIASRKPAEFDKARTYFRSLTQKLGREPEVLAAVENALGVIKFATDDAYGALRHFQTTEVKYFSVAGEVARSLYYQSKCWEKLGDAAMQKARAKDLSDYYPKSEWARKL